MTYRFYIVTIVNLTIGLLFWVVNIFQLLAGCDSTFSKTFVEGVRGFPSLLYVQMAFVVILLFWWLVVVLAVEYRETRSARKSFITIGVTNLIVTLSLAVYLWALWDYMAVERSRTRPEPPYAPPFWQILEAPGWGYWPRRSFCRDQKDFFGKWTRLDKVEEWHFYPTRKFKRVSGAGIQISNGSWNQDTHIYAVDISLDDRIRIAYFNLRERYPKVQHGYWVRNTSEDKMSVTLTNEETGENVHLRKIVEEKDIDPYRYKTWLRE